MLGSLFQLKRCDDASPGWVGLENGYFFHPTLLQFNRQKCTIDCDLVCGIQVTNPGESLCEKGFPLNIWKSVEFHVQGSLIPSRYVVERIFGEMNVGGRTRLIPFAVRHRTHNETFTTILYKNIERLLRPLFGMVNDLTLTDPRYLALTAIEESSSYIAGSRGFTSVLEKTHDNPMAGNVGNLVHNSQLMASKLNTMTSMIITSDTSRVVSADPGYITGIPEIADLPRITYAGYNTEYDLGSIAETLYKPFIHPDVPSPIDTSRAGILLRSPTSMSHLMDMDENIIATDYDVFGLVSAGRVSKVKIKEYVDRYASQFASGEDSSSVRSHADRDKVRTLLSHFVQSLVHYAVKTDNTDLKGALDGECFVRIKKTFNDEMYCTVSPYVATDEVKSLHVRPILGVHFDLAASILGSASVGHAHVLQKSLFATALHDSAISTMPVFSGPLL